MKLTDVFTPNDQPTVTYVRREQANLENQLRSAARTPNMVVSVSGPSKTGKTVLVKTVLDEDNLIYLRGAYIRTVEDFWRALLAWFEAPSEKSNGTSKTFGGKLSGQAGGELNLPWVAKGKAGASSEASYHHTNESTVSIPINPFDVVVSEISGSEFTIFIDDYHYMPNDVQTEVAQIIKSLAEENVRCITALVPHRSEDVLKANPELRGRLVSIDIPEWSSYELNFIAKKGFAEVASSRFVWVGCISGYRTTAPDVVS